MIDLILFALDGRLHAVYSNEIFRCEETGSVFRLPLHPPQMAGLSLIDDHTVTLADLAACLGFPGQSRNRRGNALFLTEGDDEIAFFVADSVHRESLPEQNLMQVPDCLESPLISRCAMIGGEVIPIVDLTLLRARLEKGHWDSPAVSFKSLSPASRPLGSSKGFRLFHLGGERFALPETDLRALPEPLVDICPLGKTPPFLDGLGRAGDCLRPVVHLEFLLGLPPASSSQVPFVGQMGEHEVIFFADNPEEKAFASSEPVLPPLAQKCGMRKALLVGGEVIPLLDLSELLQNGSPLPPLSERYAANDTGMGDPRPSFQEFSLAGTRFAVPKGESTTVLPCLQMRSIPSDLPLLRGIAEHQGALWPVIDLSPYFGGQIDPEKCGGLLAVQCGDFRALLMAEEIFGETRPDAGSRRELPLTLPQHLVFDCYLKAKEVILVLNVKAMTLNFDPEQAKSCRGAIEMEEAVTDSQVAPSTAEICEEIKERISDPRAIGAEENEALPPPTLAEEFPPTEQIQADLLTAEKEAEPSTQLPAQSAPPCNEASSPLSLREVTAHPTSQTGRNPVDPQEVDIERKDGTANLSAHEDFPPVPCVPTGPKQEVTTETDENICPQVKLPPTSTVGIKSSRPPAASSPLQPSGKAPSVSQKPMVPRPISKNESLPAQEPVPTPPANLPEEAAPKPEHFGIPTHTGAIYESRTHLPRNRKQLTSRRFTRAVVLVPLLATLITGVGAYFFFADDLPQKVADDQSVFVEPAEFTLNPETTPLAQIPDKSIPASPFTASANTAAAPDPASISNSTPTSALVGTSPPTYRVTPGDTLWDIARRRTGDPFAYRQIASENNIPNPNLIHPGQEILLP